MTRYLKWVPFYVGPQRKRPVFAARGIGLCCIYRDTETPPEVHEWWANVDGWTHGPVKTRREAKLLAARLLAHSTSRYHQRKTGRLNGLHKR